MVSKIVRLGPKGRMVLIGGEGKGEATWYSISDKVRPYLEKLGQGAEVTFKSDKIKGTDTLLEIYPANGASQSNGHVATGATKETNTSTAKTDTSTSKSWGKTPAEQDSIKRQAIGNMTSRGLIALQGLVSPDNIEEVAEKLYNKFAQLVG